MRHECDFASVLSLVTHWSYCKRPAADCLRYAAASAALATCEGCEAPPLRTSSRRPCLATLHPREARVSRSLHLVTGQLLGSNFKISSPFTILNHQPYHDSPHSTKPLITSTLNSDPPPRRGALCVIPVWPPPRRWRAPSCLADVRRGPPPSGLAAPVRTGPGLALTPPRPHSKVASCLIAKPPIPLSGSVQSFIKTTTFTTTTHALPPSAPFSPSRIPITHAFNYSTTTSQRHAHSKALAWHTTYGAARCPIPLLATLVTATHPHTPTATSAAATAASLC